MGYADKLKQNSSRIQTNEKVLKERSPVKKKAGRPKKVQEEVRNVAIPVALNNEYLSNSKLVIGLISVEAVKVVLGLIISKPKTDNSDTAIIDTIFHLPSQIV